MTTSTNKKTTSTSTKNTFKDVLEVTVVTLKLALSESIAKKPLTFNVLGEKYTVRRAKDTIRFQKQCSIFWSVLSLINMFIAFFGPANHGMLYGITSFMKYCTIGEEVHDMWAGITWDLNAGLKEYLIQETWMGELLDTLSAHNFLQFICMIVCAIVFIASAVFAFATISCCVEHFKATARTKKASSK